MTILRIFAEHKKDTEYIAFLDENQKKLGNLIQELCWDEDRFIRGFTESGETIGKRTDPEANMWLNPQSWAVISGLADEKQADCALQQVYDRLNTEYGAILMDPPYHEHGMVPPIFPCGTARGHRTTPCAFSSARRLNRLMAISETPPGSASASAWCFKRPTPSP